MASQGQHRIRIFSNRLRAAAVRLALAIVFVLTVVLAQAALFPSSAHAQVEFSYNLTCNVYNDPNCPPPGNIVLGSDSVTIAIDAKGDLYGTAGGGGAHGSGVVFEIPNVAGQHLRTGAGFQATAQHR